MPRKQVDPVVHVMAFFENQPIDSAKTALEIVSAIVARRQGAKTPPVPVKKKKPAAGPGPVATVGE